MISTYHDDLLRKLAERYQAPLGNHNILIYPEWQAFLSLTFVQGIYITAGQCTLSPPPQPKGASFAPGPYSYSIQEKETTYIKTETLSFTLQTFR